MLFRSPGVGHRLEEASRGLEYARLELDARAFSAPGEQAQAQAWVGAMTEPLPGRGVGMGPPKSHDPMIATQPVRRTSISAAEVKLTDRIDAGESSKSRLKCERELDSDSYASASPAFAPSRLLDLCEPGNTAAHPGLPRSASLFRIWARTG